MFDVHRLRLLRELKHRGTLAAVGEALGYSPSAVSHQLAILEREVGVPILEPVGRRVRLTDAAEVLVAHTERVLLELEQAEAAIAASRATVSGQVRIATFQTAAHTIIPSAVDRLAEEHPGVDVVFRHVHAEQALPALLARDVDLVLFEEYPGAPVAPITNIATEHLLDDPMLVAVPADETARRLADLADADWAMEPAGTPSRAWAVAACRSAGFEPRIAFETADVLLHVRLVAQGQAVAFLPAIIASTDSGWELLPSGTSRVIRLALRRGSEENPAIAAARRAIVRSVDSR